MGKRQKFELRKIGKVREAVVAREDAGHDTISTISRISVEK